MRGSAGGPQGGTGAGRAEPARGGGPGVAGWGEADKPRVSAGAHAVRHGAHEIHRGTAHRGRRRGPCRGPARGGGLDHPRPERAGGTGRAGPRGGRSRSAAGARRRGGAPPREAGLRAGRGVARPSQAGRAAARGGWPSRGGRPARRQPAARRCRCGWTSWRSTPGRMAHRQSGTIGASGPETVRRSSIRETGSRDASPRTDPCATLPPAAARPRRSTPVRHPPARSTHADPFPIGTVPIRQHGHHGRPAAPDGDPRRQGTAGGQCAHRIDAPVA